MKKQLLALILCLISIEAFCQQKGHFLIGSTASCIIGTGTSDSPSNLMYTIETGISYDLIPSLRLIGGFGGFRSVMSFYGNNRQYETANGPLIWIGARYFLLPEDKAIRPSASLNIGYRRAIPRTLNTAEGAFQRVALGADFHLGGLSLNISLTTELTQALRPAVGFSMIVLLP